MRIKYLNYLESLPIELKKMINEKPLAYVPFGALEWHGEHNILGVDSVKATEICKRCAEITGGVLFPCVNYGAFSTMNFPYTLHSKKRPYKKMTKKMVKQLYKMGFRIIVLLTGHYPSAQIKQVKKAAQKISSKRKDCFAIGVPEQKLVADLGYFGDHAAEWETSIMMAINSNFVNLELVPDNLNFAERARKFGILGRDPKRYASKEKGEEILHKIVERLTNAILETKNSQSNDSFERIYSNYQEVKKQKRSLKDTFEINGIGSVREGWEFYKWWKFKGKKYNPDYEYPKK